MFQQENEIILTNEKQFHSIYIHLTQMTLHIGNETKNGIKIGENGTKICKICFIIALRYQAVHQSF